MHAAVEADTEDGNAAFAGRAAGRQGGRRATILLRHANGADLHHDICAHKALSAEVPLGVANSVLWTGAVSSRTSIRIVLNYVNNRHARLPPLGYRRLDRKLVIVDSEAELVRSIFRRYAELGSVRLLKEELEAQGSKSKSWNSVAGRVIGGKPFSRGALYLMLRNRIYRGEIVHKGQSHPGEHPPII